MDESEPKLEEMTSAQVDRENRKWARAMDEYCHSDLAYCAIHGSYYSGLIRCPKCHPRLGTGREEYEYSDKSDLS